MASGALIGGDDNSNKNNNTVTDNNNGGGGNNGSSRHRWGESKVYMRKGSSKSLKAAPSQTVTEEANSSLHAGRFDAASDDSSSLSRKPAPMNREPTPNGVSRSTTTGGGGAGGSSSGGFLRSENRVTINLTSKSKQEMRELRRKLTSELEQVRSLFNRLESRELQLRGYSAGAAVDNSGYSPPQVSGNGVKKTKSEVVASIGGAPLRQLIIPVVEHSQVGSDLVEKEKRTPKANQYYRNSDFVLGKDKFPPPESSSKKAKANGNVGSRQQDYPVDKGTSQTFKQCGAILAKLMKHKHSWVFNTPVDVKGLGLHDYYSIIKHPMDLGTVKSRLNSNWYSSPTEFAEDVRLTFRNAMTYNPKGHDVHFMAEQLLKIFDDRWRILEAELVDDRLNSRFTEMEPDGGYSQVTKRGPPALAAAPPPPEPMKVLDRSESTTVPSEPKSKPGNAPSVRTPAPKKPKAKDPHKRDMTYEEKQKLSMNLQNLPSEKLDNIVQIIKKRNSSLCQHDDEIEVDIDSVDAETLWELDRFVTNYKKSLSKNRKKAELANQARAVSEHMPVEKASISDRFGR